MQFFQRFIYFKGLFYIICNSNYSIYSKMNLCYEGEILKWCFMLKKGSAIKALTDQ